MSCRELTGRERSLVTNSQGHFKTARWELADYSKMKIFFSGGSGLLIPRHGLLP